MNIINRFASREELLQFRDHLGKVLADSMSLPLKPRKLDELTARVLGAADFNTALGLVPEAASGHYLVAQESLDPAEFGLEACATTDDGRCSIKFDAAAYFAYCLANHSLVILLKGLMERRAWTGYCCEGSEITDCIAEFFMDGSTAAVFNYLESVNKPDDDEGRGRDVGYECFIEPGEIVKWLNAQRQFILASWVEAYFYGESIREYEASNPQDAYHLEHSPDESERFHQAVEPDFEIFFDFNRSNNFKWRHGERIGPNGFTSEKLAIVHYLDNLIDHPAMDRA